VPSAVGDLLEAVCPFVTASGKDRHRLVDEVDLDAIAVELDFVIHLDPEGALAIEVARAGSMKPGKGALMAMVVGFRR